MLFITPMTSTEGAKKYFSEQLAPSDYYLRDAQEQPGQWHGLGADLLGLFGQVNQDDFFRLCENIDPRTGEALTARTKSNRRVGYDFTFDAPKAVTLALELGGDERILDAFREAVGDTMAELEAGLHARVRAGGQDSDRQTSNMVWADFIHRTTRPVDGVPDPQLHCHAVVFNATFDAEEEQWKAGQFAPLVRDKLYYQAAFHARLASRLTALGYEVRREGNSFTLAGLDRATILKYSRRLQQIDAEADRLGVKDQNLKRELGKRTRDAKSGGASLSELREEWLSRLSAEDREQLARLQGEGACVTTEAAQASIEYAVAHSFERASVVPEEKVLAEALMHGVGKVSVDETRRQWQCKKPDDAICRPVEGQTMVTTKEVYREEIAMLRYARDGRGQCHKLGDVSALEGGLSDEQRAAAGLILNSRDRVIGLRGGAGTGKTRMMQATVKAIEATGKSVFTFAPSAKASRGVLRDEGFASADTVQRLLIDKELQASLRGQVVWIDEAGLLSTRDMRKLFDLADAQGFRLVLSGDSAQHGAVGRGDALRLLEKEAGMQFAQLKDIRRQTVAEYREAVREIAAGDVPNRDGQSSIEAGIARLDRMGAIVETQGIERHRRLAADYADSTSTIQLGKVKTALVVSPTHGEGEAVAAVIRSELKSRGRLQGQDREFLSLRSLGLTEAQRGEADSYVGGEIVRFHQNVRGFKKGEGVAVISSDGKAVRVRKGDGAEGSLPLSEAGRFEVYEARTVRLTEGDRIRITQNGSTVPVKRGGKLASSRLNNGDLFEVKGFTRAGDILLANGFVVSKNYGGIAQGYVVTSHASQGSTVDQVLIALGSESLAAANRQQFYVSVSRGREAVRLYTDDKEALEEAVKSDGSRLSAIELLQGTKPRPKRPATSARLMAMQRARRNNQAWRDRVLYAQAHSQEGHHVGH
jgi:conjugative relaxase-like TrwC/TraI family protein